MTKLYIVEGLPCSGKSTTAQSVCDTLRKQGKDVVIVDEGTGNHPADYEFHAYMAEDGLEKLDEQHDWQNTYAIIREMLV